MILYFLLFTIIVSKIYYLSDIKYPIPYCDSDSYHLNNIMGYIDITNDPLLYNLIIKFYLYNISSCDLCRHENERYCNNQSDNRLYFEKDVLYNFRITVKRESYGEFSTLIKNLTTKYFIENDSIELQIPIKTLLHYNNDYGNPDCNDKFHIILSILAYTDIRKTVFVLTPVELIKTIDNNYYILNTYNLLCIPTEEYLSNFDCSQSNIYRVNIYNPENCLIQKNETKYSDYGNNYIQESFLDKTPSSLTCSVYNHIYYDSRLFNNKKIDNFISLDSIICNETWNSVLKRTIYDRNYLFQCNSVLNTCGYNQYKPINDLIYLKPFYRLYKEIIIGMFNYLGCLSLNNTRIINIEKLLHRSIGILKASCYFKDDLLGDYEEYNNLIYQLLLFNTNGYGHCMKCNVSKVTQCNEQVYYCQSIYSNYIDSREYIDNWYQYELNNDIEDPENITEYDRFLRLFLEESQYQNNSTLFLVVILLIFIIIISIIVYLCIIKIVLLIVKKK